MFTCTVALATAAIGHYHSYEYVSLIQWSSQLPYTGNFGGGNFWQIITDEAIAKKNFGKSAGSLSVIPYIVFIYIISW